MKFRRSKFKSFVTKTTHIKYESPITYHTENMANENRVNFRYDPLGHTKTRARPVWHNTPIDLHKE
jgi:hypothetical protein